MPLARRPAGHNRRPRWPLAAAWAVSVADLVVVALLPRAAAHAYGAFLLAGSAGPMIVVVAYARLLRRGRDGGQRPAADNSVTVPGYRGKHFTVRARRDR